MIIFLDSNVLIYLIEGDALLAAKIKQTIQRYIDTSFENVIAVSSLALLECRVLPLRNNDIALLKQYDDFFSTDGLLIVDLSRNVLDIATRLRSYFGLKTPDALQAACCLSLQSPHVFLTDDNGFRNVDALNVRKATKSDKA